MDPSKLTEYITAIGAGVAPLADKLSASGKEVFAYAVRHSYAVAYGDIGMFVLSLIGGGIMAKVLQQGITPRVNPEYPRDPPQSYFYRNEGWGVVAGVASTVMGILIIISAIVVVGDAIPRLVAPEWSAISDIADAFKSKK